MEEWMFYELGYRGPLGVRPLEAISQQVVKFIIIHYYLTFFLEVLYGIS